MMRTFLAAALLFLTGSARAVGFGFGVNVVETVQRSTLTFSAPITFTAPLTIQTTNFVTVQQSSAVFTEKIRVGLVDGTTIHSDGYIDFSDRSSPPSTNERGVVYFDTSEAGGVGALRVSLDGVSFVSLATGSVSGAASIVSNAAQFSGDGTGGSPLTLKSSSVTLQGQNVVLKTGDTMSGTLTVNASVVVNGVTDFGSRTNSQIGALVCSSKPCRVQSADDDDIYTATGTVAGQWRNSRQGTGPLIP